MRFHFLLAGSILATVLYASAQQDQGEKPEETMRSVQGGVYTEEQAERGLKLFEDVCASCHEPAEFGDGAYIDSWSGQTAHDLIEQIRSTMPQDNPGSLKRKDYVDVVAYLFRLNGLPKGDAEMDQSSVKQIRIEGPYTPQQR
jgi:mono/diheme cytochrome c family protein